jgi:hypothetical protein
MFFRLVFKHFSEEKKARMIREKGILVGSRLARGRKVFLYMIKDFFAEVYHAGDELDGKPEKIEIFSNLNLLNAYLEQECRSAL